MRVMFSSSRPISSMTVYNNKVELVFATAPSPIDASLVPYVNRCCVVSYLYSLHLRSNKAFVKNMFHPSKHRHFAPRQTGCGTFVLLNLGGTGFIYRNQQEGSSVRGASFVSMFPITLLLNQCLLRVEDSIFHGNSGTIGTGRQPREQ